MNVIVMVQFWTLQQVKAIFNGQRMKMKMPFQQHRFFFRRFVEINPIPLNIRSAQLLQWQVVCNCTVFMDRHNPKQIQNPLSQKLHIV
ncbi:hypothetical protein [Paenibacillus cisolokensis]|uniref:hypothetical protein n=1 Tax=Paenibacillus cisolokensis TaxID=1658519 RepID=UPI003556933F